MSKRYYFPNKTIKDSKLPFWLEITSGLKAYARHSTGELRRCETIELKKKRWLVINHQGFIITLKGFEPEKECPECKGEGLYFQKNPDCKNCITTEMIDDCATPNREYCCISTKCYNCKGKGKLPEHFIYEIKEESRTIHKTQNIGATNEIM